MSSSDDVVVIDGGAPDDADPGKADGSPQDSGQKTSAEENDKAEDLRKELTNKGTQVKQYEAIFQYMNENPHLTFEQVQRIAAGEQIDTAKKSKVDDIVAKFEDSGTQDAMKELAAAIREEVRSEFAPRVADAQRLRAEAEEERLLRVNGVDPFDQEFIESRSDLEDRRYKKLKQVDPAEAATYLSERWQARSSKPNKAQKRRVDEAKQVSLESGSSRRTAQSQSVADVEFKRDNVRMTEMFKALKGKKRIALVRGKRN